MSQDQQPGASLGFTPVFVLGGNSFFLRVKEAFKGTQLEAHAVGHGLTFGPEMVPGLVYSGQVAEVTEDTEHVPAELVGLPVGIFAGPLFDQHKPDTVKGSANLSPCAYCHKPQSMTHCQSDVCADDPVHPGCDGGAICCAAQFVHRLDAQDQADQ